MEAVAGPVPARRAWRPDGLRSNGPWDSPVSAGHARILYRAPDPRSRRQASPARTTITVLTVTMWLCVTTQKLALPGNIEVTVVFLVGALAFLVMTGRAFVSLPRFAAFAALVTAIAASQVIPTAHRDLSLPALFIALSLYALFVFVIPLERRDILTVIRRFQWLALFIAAMVGVDWLFQLAGRPMPSFEAFVPHGALFEFYNYIQPLTWKAAYSKPNGFFMLEASHTSQLMAMGLVIEICLFRRLPFMAAFACAQLASFGGTGFVMLLSAIPAMLFMVRGRTLLMVAGLCLVVAAGASQTPVWKNFAKRSTEVGHRHSSGNGRFVEPYLFMTDIISSSDEALLTGLGPGNGKAVSDRTQQLVMNPVAKAVVEYGLPAGFIWMLFIHLCVLRSPVPTVVAILTLVQYDFLNGSLLVPINIAYCFLLAAAFANPARVRDGVAPYFSAGTVPYARARLPAVAPPFRKGRT